MSNVVITGSTKGIGFGLAAEFAKQGHNVCVAGRSDASVDDAVNRINSGKPAGRVTGKATDTVDAAAVQALWDHAAESFGSVDIWVNNAGLARTTWSILDIPDAEIEAMVTTNMLGTINGCRVAMRGMLAQPDSHPEQKGKLFNMLGGGSDGEIFPGMGIYGSTKRGLDYFTNALIKEHKDSGVVIGKIRPGMIITDAVIREAKQDLDYFNQSRKQMNNLVDTVETVSPYLVEQILATTKSGTKIRWLTGGKIAKRMLMARIKPRPDQFEQFGL